MTEQARGASADAAADRHAASGVRTRGRRPPPSPKRVGAEIVVVSVVLGVLMGVAWYRLSPEIVGEAAETGVAIPIAQARQLFDQVAIFTLLGAGVGLVLGVLFGTRYRRRPVTVLLALVLGGLGGSGLAWGIGVWMGPSLGSPEPGAEVTLPMELDAPAALIVWPVVAVVVVTVMSLFRDDRTPWVWNGGTRG